MVSPELFKDLVFCIIGKTSIPSFKLSDEIKKYGGIISYTIYNQVNLVITGSITSIGDSKLKQIQSVPSIMVLDEQYIRDCINTDCLIKNYSKYNLLQKNISGEKQSEIAIVPDKVVVEAKDISLNQQQNVDDGNLSQYKLGDNEIIKIDPTIKYISGITIYNEKDKVQPKFKDNYQILATHLLQCTSIVSNYNVNKYYCMEFQKCFIEGFEKYRIYTQFGRTDDPKGKQIQHRYFNDFEEAVKVYSSIYNSKTSTEGGGYQPLTVNHSSIGSRTKFGINETVVVVEKDKDIENNSIKTYISKEVGRLIELIFEASTNSIISSFNVEITERGVSTPMGTLGSLQIAKGQEILKTISQTISRFSVDDPTMEISYNREIQQQSSEFYSCIPSRIGLKVKDKNSLSISTMEKVSQLAESLQLMKDLAMVYEENSKQLKTSTLVDMQYNSLKIDLNYCQVESSDYQIVYRLLNNINNQNHNHNGELPNNIKINNVYRIRKDKVETNYREEIGNHRLLYHGTKMENVVGILNRGLLLPDMVLSKGGKLTDRGNLGSGIYFGDQVLTSLKFTHHQKQKNNKIANSSSTGGVSSQYAYVFVCQVALGNQFRQSKIDYSLVSPPLGYDSCIGYSTTPSNPTDFPSNEYVIYDTNQQKLVYLIEILKN